MCASVQPEQMLYFLMILNCFLYPARFANFLCPPLFIQQQLLMLQVKFPDVRIRKILEIPFQIFLSHFLRVKYMNDGSRHSDLGADFRIEDPCRTDFSSIPWK